MRRDPIVVVAYDPAWPASFETQRQRVEPVLAPWLTQRVEHIGSTAIPGLPAKSIIDMLAVVRDTEQTRGAVSGLAALGWCHAPEPTDDLDRQLSFCFPTQARRSHHLHVVEADAPAWAGWLAFRDYLRANPLVAQEYAELKVRLAAAHGDDPNDRSAYRDGKAPFIAEMTRRALTGRGGPRRD